MVSLGLRGVWQVGAAPFDVFARTKPPCSQVKTSRFPFGEVTSEPLGPTETQSFGCFMALCAPVILTNSAVGVQEQDYIGTSWEQQQPIHVTCSRRGPVVSARPSSSGGYATMTFSCSSWFPGKPRLRTSTPPRRPCSLTGGSKRRRMQEAG